ncbi:MAG: hypothetical protein R6V47_08110 [Candidatus Delongbacteria bacterium]
MKIKHDRSRNSRYLKHLLIIIILVVFSVANSKEVTDHNGKICHTIKLDKNMVEFVMIRGVSVLMYESRSMRKPTMSLKNKTFVEYMDRDGRLIKIRAYDGINPPSVGWITRFQVYEKNDAPTIFYGKPFPADKPDVKSEVDVKLDKTVWITKDVTKLYYEPEPESDYKYEIYFGLRLQVKRQRGDYYFVMIYNSILDEYRPGWVKIEDTGTYEYFEKEYQRRRADYEKDLRSIAKQIDSMEKIAENLNKEIYELKHDKDILYSKKYERLQTIDNLKAKKREKMDEDQKKKMDRIEKLKENIEESIEAVDSVDHKIKELEKTRKLLAEGIKLEERKISDLRSLISDIREKRIGNRSVRAEIKSIKGELSDIEEAYSEEIQTAEQENEDPCSSIKTELLSKKRDFEEIRDKLSKVASKNEYDMYYDEYMNIWSEIVELKKDSAECMIYSENKHIALYNEAIELKSIYEYDDALELLLEAVDIKNDFDEAYYQIVLILILLDEDSSVDKYIEKISEPQRKGVLFHKRASSVKDRYPDRAIRYYREMAKYYKPDLAFYLSGLVHIEKLSDFEKGIKELKKSLELDYESPKTLEALGAAYMERKKEKGKSKNEDVKIAIDYFEKAFKHAEGYNNFDVLCARLSQAYNILGKATSALKYANIAIKNTRMDPFGLAHLEKAKALIKMDKKKEAEKNLKTAKRDLTVKREADYWLNEIKK